MRSRRRILASVASLCLAFATAAAAQHTLPSSDIYLAKITRDRQGGVRLDEPVNVTKRKGYDNQPAFSADGKSLYYVAWEKNGADIWVLDVQQRTRRAIRSTPSWEFSPAPVPGDEAVAVIKVVGPKHELWRYPLNPEEPPTALLPDVGQIGFFAWIDGENVLYHELSRPTKLRQVRAGGPGLGEILAESVGRTLKNVPGTKDVLFLHDDDGLIIKRLNGTSGAIEAVLSALPEHEFFAVSGDGTMWTSDGEAVFTAPPGETTWKKVADVSDEVENVTRLAVNPQGTLLALVGDE